MIVKFTADSRAPGSHSPALTTSRGVPERRRVVVLGAGAAGLTAALHLGAHSVLIDQSIHVGSNGTGQRPEGGNDDRKSNFTLGADRADVVGPEEGDSRGERNIHGAWERREIPGAQTPRADAADSQPVVVARWVAPQLGPASPAGSAATADSLQTLVPLLRGELRLATRVARIIPTSRLLELSDGTSIIYDKLVSSISAVSLLFLLQPGPPNRIRSHQGLVYWLAARDVELIDDSTQLLMGDANPFEAGRRVAESVNRALAQKFRPLSEILVRGGPLFKPTLVQSSSASVAS